ncbi:hypothetical protein QV06_00215 [Gallibacterium genomosp. 3]|uniref:Uncharacterized protein n=1 Tax=Gallibacterium genomosp. 3 TaxID=505345 RepID=A0A1A7PVE6_9PAST|nr:hypothetical protein [Gallibacterium genomosp. 3]OBX06014.1 hypothetical protein QV06_00215 [Gallibacterium genomosp. 3]
MLDKVRSIIKDVNLDDGEIIIHKLDKNRKDDIVCKKAYYEKSLSRNDLESLKEGDEVEFYPTTIGSKIYAKELKILSNSSIHISTIKYIDREREQIIINRISREQDKDFLCIKQYYSHVLTDTLFKSLSVGDKVKFKSVIKDNKFYAELLEVLTTQELKEETIKVNTKFLTENLIESIRSSLNEINKGADFEDFVFFIFKLLGISEIYAVPKNNAGGRADGIFKVSNISTNTPKLEVIYDCTLDPNWEIKKKEQIKNYKSQICRSSMSIDYEFIESTSNKKIIKTSILFNNNSQKEIWIITKSSTRVVENSQEDISGEQMSILVKEVSIFDLIKILENKLHDTKYIKIDDIADRLKHI